MKFHIVTIFPEMFDSYLGESILKRAKEKGLVDFKFYNPRDFTTDKHHKVDDRPYGGGPGMVMYAEPILKAVTKATHLVTRLLSKKGGPARTAKRGAARVILFSPSGAQFTNEMAEKMAKKGEDLVLISGRYEGIDSRVKKALKATEISVGPYVLTGGELPAMVVIDAITRRLKGALGKAESIEEKRISSSEMYTRPEVMKWKGKTYKVPKVLLSGHQKKIDEYRKKR